MIQDKEQFYIWLLEYEEKIVVNSNLNVYAGRDSQDILNKYLNEKQVVDFKEKLENKYPEKEKMKGKKI